MDATRTKTWRDRWVWWFLALLVVIGGWIAFDDWQDTDRENDRRTTDYICAIDPSDPDC